MPRRVIAAKAGERPGANQTLELATIQGRGVVHEWRHPARQKNVRDFFAHELVAITSEADDSCLFQEHLIHERARRPQERTRCNATFHRAADSFTTRLG